MTSVFVSLGFSNWMVVVVLVVFVALGFSFLVRWLFPLLTSLDGEMV